MEKGKKRERPAFNKDVSAAMAEHYAHVRTKRPLAYTLMSSNPLIEVAYAAGIQPAFPENYACVSAARHKSREYCDAAEAANYSQDICSYCRNHMGYVRSQDTDPPMGGMGDPDMLLMSSSACTHYFKWWDTLRETTGKPLVFVNTPRVMETGAVPDYYLPFTMEEIRLAITEIERISGIQIDPERLARAVQSERSGGPLLGEDSGTAKGCSRPSGTLRSWKRPFRSDCAGGHTGRGGPYEKDLRGNRPAG